VELLHARGKATLSLIAELQGTVVAHVLFSPVHLDPPHPRFKAVGLAPLAVLPSYQRRGIGSRLVRDGLRLCGDAGYDVVVVLGDPGFYSGFGFVRASENGLACDYGDEHFLVTELRPRALHGIRGRVKYESEFSDAGR
jgi:putative acetyltransferase